MIPIPCNLSSSAAWDSGNGFLFVFPDFPPIPVTRSEHVGGKFRAASMRGSATSPIGLWRIRAWAGFPPWFVPVQMRCRSGLTRPIDKPRLTGVWACVERAATPTIRTGAI